MTIFQTFKDFLKIGSKEDLIKKCGPFIEESKGLPLYRGYGMKMSAALHGQREVTVRKDRKPRDTSIEIHNIMNAYFFKKFGVNVRSEGLFAIGDIKRASSYGHPHYVLPVGKFKYVWAEWNGKPVHDTLAATWAIKDAMWLKPAADQERLALKALDEFTWHSTDLPRAIKSHAEIALLCDKAIIIPVGDIPYSEIIGVQADDAGGAQDDDRSDNTSVGSGRKSLVKK